MIRRLRLSYWRLVRIGLEDLALQKDAQCETCKEKENGGDNFFHRDSKLK